MDGQYALSSRVPSIFWLRLLRDVRDVVNYAIPVVLLEAVCHHLVITSVITSVINRIVGQASGQAESFL